MPEPEVHRAMAASAIADVVTGPERAARVLAARPGVVVVSLGDVGRAVTGIDASPRCLCLLAHGMARLPNALQVDPAGLTDPPPAGAPVVVGAGAVWVGHRVFTVVRWWDSTVRPVRVSVAGLARLQRVRSTAELGVPPAALARLVTALAAPDPDGLADAVGGLVGSGRGLTPGGDDALAGLCVGAHATGGTVLLARLGAAGLTDADGRTTTLSADLLRLALRGQAGGEVLRVVRALHAVARDPHRRPGLDAAVRDLLALGHTSGADLLAGLLLGLRVGADDRAGPDAAAPAGGDIVVGAGTAADNGPEAP